MIHAEKMGIIVAMNEEIELMQQHFNGFKILNEEPYTIFETSLGNKKIYITHS